MPSYYPEGDIPLSTDNRERSLQKINSLLSSGVPGVTPPTADSNLWLWASSDTGITYEAVTFKMRYTNDWLDRSVNGRHLSSVPERYTKYVTAPANPMPSGKPVVRFDPTDPGGPPIPTQYTVSTGGLANLGTAHSVYMLLYIPAWEYPKYFFDGGAAANTSGISMQPNLPSRVSLSAPSLAPTLTSMPTGTWCVLTAIFNTLNSTLQFNNGTVATGNPGSNTPNWAWVGGITTVGVYHAKFDLGAIIISNSANDAATQAIHKNWLADYGGITLDPS